MFKLTPLPYSYDALEPVLSEECYGPPRVRPAMAGGGFFRSRDKFSRYVFAGASGRAVAYNIALDGNAFRDGGHSVDRRPLVAEGQAGLVMLMGRVQTALAVVTRTDQFKSQGKQELFGAISLSMKLQCGVSVGIGVRVSPLVDVLTCRCEFIRTYRILFLT